MDSELGRELASLDLGMDVNEAIEVVKAFTGTTELAVFIPEIWAQEIERQAQPARVMRGMQPQVVLNTDLLEKPGDIVHISKMNSLVAATKLVETTTIIPQAMGGTDITLEPDEWGTGVEVSRKALRRAYINTMDEAATLLGEALAQGEDVEIMTQAIAGVSNIIYPPDRTAIGQIVADDIMTPDILRRARTALRNLKIKGPFVAIIHTACEGDLLGDEQFIDASKYGNNEVVLNGEIGKFLGIKIVATTNVISANDGSAGIEVFRNMLLGPRSLAIAIKANPDYQEDYKPKDRATDMVSVMEFETKTLNAERYAVMYTA